MRNKKKEIVHDLKNVKPINPTLFVSLLLMVDKKSVELHIGAH